MLSSRPPTFDSCLSFPMERAFTRNLTNTTNPAANAAPLSISPILSLDANLQTPTIRIIAAVSFSIIPPILLTSPLCFDTAPSIVTNASIPTAITASLSNPFVAVVSSIPPSNLTEAATNNIAKAIWSRLSFKPLISIFLLAKSNVAEDFDINCKANANPTRMAANAATTPTAFQSLPTSLT